MPTASAAVHLVRLTMKPDSPFIDREHSMRLHVDVGDRVEKGQVIASGRVRQGDHIFVNKVLFHFTRPQRGQIVVFDTNFIPGKERSRHPAGHVLHQAAGGVAGGGHFHPRPAFAGGRGTGGGAVAVPAAGGGSGLPRLRAAPRGAV
jgi:hypothetical protein